MANQPSKYSKFLVGAASAALVASAVAPVASAADFKDTKGNTHEEAINALSDSGVIKGYSDGTFLPNKTLTRSDVVKMMGKWLVTEGHAIPADARTNPRFTDLSTKSNAELLDYAAVVKDAGVFIGSNGKLLAVDNITRENMALVLVRAFDTVEKIDLATYVAGQDFKRDVKDLTSAKSEARAAIDVLDFFDITNPTVASFNPKGNTTRGHFATFLHKTINADFSKVAGEAAEGVVSVKAVNATTVEVAFKEDAKDVNASDYSIEGLAISNAAVKQTDSKVVVLTTAVQAGDKEYTVKSGASTLGKFKGISGVIPTKITMNTASTQGVVGKEVTLKADIGVKEAGVPVTFNVAAGSKLNKDHIEEVTTDAEGIATYSYTQYVSGEQDDVVAYPTGAPSVRSLAAVYWGVDSILTVTESDDKQGNNVANGANKVYKVTYKNPKTGTPVANQKMHVTFAENIDVNIDKVSPATINGVNPVQLLNGTTPTTAVVTTDSKGEATITVSGSNTKVTPVVFLDQIVDNKSVNTLSPTKLQSTAGQVTFGAIQSTYDIQVTREGGEEAAIGLGNGREYKVVVKTKDGKEAANEIVNVAFNENIDRVISTNTDAVFVEDGVSKGKTGYSVKTNSKGEATFTIASESNDKDYATPVVWIDINSSNAKDGQLDDGETSKIAPVTYFAKEKLTSGAVKAYKNNTTTELKSDEVLKGTEYATFTYTAANQSGNKVALGSDYKEISATFTVHNTGSSDVYVNGDKTKVVSPNRSLTVTVDNQSPSITVQADGDKTTSVKVEATGTAVGKDSTVRSAYLGNYTATAAFKATTEVGTVETGLVETLNTEKKEIKLYGKNKVSYKGASFYNELNQPLKEELFETLVTANETAVTIKKDGDKLSITIIKDYELSAEEALQQDFAKAITTADDAVEEKVPTTGVAPGTTLVLPTTSNGVTIAWALNNVAAVNGEVTVPTTAGTYSLKATFTKSGVTKEEVYSVKVQKVIDTSKVKYSVDTSKAELGELTLTFTTEQVDLGEFGLEGTLDLAGAFGTGTTATGKIDGTKLVVTVKQGTDIVDLSERTEDHNFKVVLSAKDVANLTKEVTVAKTTTPSEVLVSNLERATIKTYLWNGTEFGASVVLQLADTTLETLPAGAKVSVLDEAGVVLATNTAKTDISVVRSGDQKYGATTTFIYGDSAYNGASWKTTEGSISSLDQVKKVKIEYSIGGTSYTKTVEVEAYDHG